MWPYPKIIAHRGGGSLAPENTLAAIRCGLSHGFHAIEIDVMLSADAIPIVMHDPRFGRTVSGAGNVSDSTMKELTTMDAGSWFSPAFAGEPVATYTQVQHFCAENNIWMNVEIKPAPGFDKRTGEVVATLTRHLFADAIALHRAGVNDNILPLFSSFSFEALLAAKSAAPEIPRGYLVNVIPDDWHERLSVLDAIALHTNHKNLSAAQAREIKKTGVGLFCYTVNDLARAKEILSWGVDAFCTDRIDLIGPNFN